MDNTMTKELVIDALMMAYHRQKPRRGLIHHSDRGVQYASNEYKNTMDCGKEEIFTTSKGRRAVTRYKEKIIEMIDKNTIEKIKINHKRASIVEQPFGTIKNTLAIPIFKQGALIKMLKGHYLPCL